MIDQSLENTLRLVALAQNDDEEALAALFQRYLPRVRRIASIRLGAGQLPVADADDVVQEAMVDAFRGLRDFDVSSEGRFCNWLAKIVENRIRMIHRKERSNRRGAGHVRVFADTEESRLGALVPGSEPSPTQHASSRETDKGIERVLQALSERYREVLIHRTFCQMSYPDIVEEMGLASESAARSLHSKAVRELTIRLQSLRDAGE